MPAAVGPISAATSRVSSHSTATSNDWPAARGSENDQKDADDLTVRAVGGGRGARGWRRRVSTATQADGDDGGAPRW